MKITKIQDIQTSLQVKIANLDEFIAKVPSMTKSNPETGEAENYTQEEQDQMIASANNQKDDINVQLTFYDRVVALQEPKYHVREVTSNDVVNEIKEITRVIVEKDETIMQAMEAHSNSMIANINATAYAENRKKEYAKLDSLRKEAYDEEKLGRPEKMQEYLAAITAIREQFPKPE